MKKRTIIAVLLTAGAVVGTYKLWHHTSALIFISIMILSFLLSYKITDYIADFKTVKNNSRIDIIFLLIFFILLCIPGSHISKAKKAQGENRYLAKKAKFINNHKLNMSYGKEFNEWFEDRFNLRKNMIRWKVTIDCSLNTTYCGNKKITYYKKGHLFYRESYYGAKEIAKNKQQILNEYANNINKLQRFCNDKNIKLYLLIIPRQAEFFDYPLADKRNYEADPADEIIDYLKLNTNTNIIYPKAAMKEANKETPVYFKTDHHWTKKGAYASYYELMKEIKKDFPSVPVLQENSLEKYYDNRVSEWWDRKFNEGQTFRHLGLSKKRYSKNILDTPYLYYKNPNRDKLETNAKFAPIIEIGFNSIQDNQFYYPNGLDKKVLLIANSFGANLVEFLPYSFKYTARYYDNDRHMILNTYRNAIDSYQPDILILNMQTAYINQLLNLYPNKFSHKEGQ